MRKLNKYKPLYSGSGIIKDISNKIFNIDFNEYNKKSSDTLKLVGNDIINKIVIIRTPINSLIENALNVISLGKFIKNKPYDKLFHLSMIVNDKILIEKNQSINISLNIDSNKDSQYYTINWFKKDITITTFLENARISMGNNNYYDYNAYTNNCQNFIINLLRTNKIYDNLAERFILQNIDKLIENMPEYSKVLSTGLTDLGASIERIIGGKINNLNFI